jgi:hypothetical protein
MTIIINGSNTPTAGAVAVGDGTTLNFTAAGTAGQVLTSNGAAVPTWTDNGSGTVTTASVVSANGFAGTVANASTTPAITLTTSITGVIKGNGTALSAATAGTDYLAPPSGTALLKANSGGALANAVAGTDYIAPSGALGTPSSGTLTNTTGLPISTGVSGLGTNVATWLGTPSSANLISVVTDETGSGVLVFNTNAALTNPTVTNYVETPFSANSSTAITLALTDGTVQIITLTGNATITMPTAVSGKSFIMYLKQDATGSRTVTWSTVKWAGNTAPTITATASRQDIYSFFSDGTNWYGVTVSQNYTP